MEVANGYEVSPLVRPFVLILARPFMSDLVWLFTSPFVSPLVYDIFAGMFAVVVAAGIEE